MVKEQDWEQVDRWMQRLKVPTGWLVRDISRVCNSVGDGYGIASVTFVYDPDHEWVTDETTPKE